MSAPVCEGSVTPLEKSGSTNRLLLASVVALFFIWGLATVLIDTLIPKLKTLFTLTYTEVMLTQFCFFLAYFLFSLPASSIVARLGYVRGIITGLAVMSVGCLLFMPAVRLGLYESFLVALFVMACGITLLQVAANPFITLLGPSQQAHSRLTLAQAFNSLGTTVGPLIGAALILGSHVAETPDLSAMSAPALHQFRVEQAREIQVPFIGIAVVLGLVALVFLAFRNVETQAVTAPAASGRSVWSLLRNRRLALGTAGIFFYVGAEVSVGSVLINYLMEPETLTLRASRAGQLVSLYWGGAMVGRFVAAGVLRRVPAGRVLAMCAFTAALLATTSWLAVGWVAAVSVIAIGLFNSVMFPLIFSLAIEGCGEDTPRASGLVCMAIVGGAIVPLITGAVADFSSLSTALLVPAACYLYVAFYGLGVQRGRLPAPQ